MFRRTVSLESSRVLCPSFDLAAIPHSLLGRSVCGRSFINRSIRRSRFGGTARLRSRPRIPRPGCGGRPEPRLSRASICSLHGGRRHDGARGEKSHRALGVSRRRGRWADGSEPHRGHRSVGRLSPISLVLDRPRPLLREENASAVQDLGRKGFQGRDPILQTALLKKKPSFRSRRLYIKPALQALAVTQTEAPEAACWRRQTNRSMRSCPKKGSPLKTMVGTPQWPAASRAC